MREKILLGIAVFVLAGIMVPMPLASADDNDTVCSGFIIGGEFDNVIVNPGDSCTMDGSTINGDFIANGAVNIVLFEFMDPMTVGGNIQIRESTGFTRITDADVGGNIQIEKSQSSDHFILVTNNNVGQNIEVKDSQASFISISGNTLGGGNIILEKNTVFDDDDMGMAAIIVSSNSFSSGNIKVVENTATATGGMGIGNIRIANNGSSESGPQNIEVEKNTASDPGGGTINVSGNFAEENVKCFENSPAPTASVNTGKLEGQCAP